MKYLMFIESDSVFRFVYGASIKGYTVTKTSEGDYGHFVSVDLENKTLEVSDRKEGIEYSTIIDFEL